MAIFVIVREKCNNNFHKKHISHVQSSRYKRDTVSTIDQFFNIPFSRNEFSKIFEVRNFNGDHI